MDLPSILKKRYKLLGEIGSGGMGVVYKAHDSLLDKTVAIKVLLSSAGERFAVRFQNEAKAFARLSHDNVVQALDFGVLDHKTPYLVMEFVDGKTLGQVLQEDGFIAIREALPMFVQICAGVENAHRHGMLHRDIKPSNIMIIPRAHDNALVKILDFGIVKFDRDEQELTTSGAGVGTANYMSPEQARGEKVDARSDIYSIGCLMFEALTGRTPFVEES